MTRSTSSGPRRIAIGLVALACAATTVGGPAVDDREVDPIKDLRERARPLSGAESLGPLLESIADRRCVLLGETSHGTEEWYAWRARITKRLVAEHDFRFVAFEGDWGAWRTVNRYVTHADDAPAHGRAALAAFSRWPGWMWNNQVTLELVEWLREHNASLPAEARVGVYGIDLYGLGDSLAKAPRHLAVLHAGAAAEAERAYACLAPFADNPQRYVTAVAQTGQSCAAPMRAVVDALRANRAEWRALNLEAYFHAKQNALVALNAEAHYRAMIDRGSESWNIRARHFHETVARLLDRYGPDGRGIVWAHNTHIGDARATAMGDRGMVNIGQLMRESHGDDAVALVGFATHGGTVVAGARWGATPQVMTMPSAAAGSLGNLLMRVGAEPFMLLMDEVRDVAALRGRIGHRAVGVTYSPTNDAGNYVQTLVPRRYDAVLFVPETTALRMVAPSPESEPDAEPDSVDREH